MIKIGDKIPDAKLMYIGDTGPNVVATEDLFGGKTVALFGVPGAFTPTCSNQHLPGFIEQAEAFAQKGIDQIICIAVTDAFVMEAWGTKSNVDGKILMVADGNCELTDKMGLDMDGSGFIMGKRSQRYSMLVRDGVVEQLNIESQAGMAEESGADALLAQI